MLHETSLAITQPYDLSVPASPNNRESRLVIRFFCRNVVLVRTDDNDVFECKVSYNRPV